MKECNELTQNINKSKIVREDVRVYHKIIMKEFDIDAIGNE